MNAQLRSENARSQIEALRDKSYVVMPAFVRALQVTKLNAAKAGTRSASRAEIALPPDPSGVRGGAEIRPRGNCRLDAVITSYPTWRGFMR